MWNWPKSRSAALRNKTQRDGTGQQSWQVGKGMSVKLSDAATGRLIRTLEGHAGEVNSVAFSADGSRVVSGSSDKTLKLWDAATGQLIRTFEGHSPWVSSVAFSPDGRRIVSGSRDTTIRSRLGADEWMEQEALILNDSSRWLQ